MKRFCGSGTDYIEINNGHTESINSIEFVDDYAHLLKNREKLTVA